MARSFRLSPVGGMETAGGQTLTYPICCHAWIRMNAAVGAGEFPVPLGYLEDVGLFNGVYFVWTDAQKLLATAAVDSSFGTAAAPTKVMEVGQYHSMCAVWASASARTIWQDGVQGDDVTGDAKDMNDNDKLWFGDFDASSSDCDCDISWPVWWSAKELTDEQIIALAGGCHPLCIEPDSIFSYIGDGLQTGQGGEQGIIGPDFLNSGTFTSNQIDGAPVTFPNTLNVQAVSAAPSFVPSPQTWMMGL